MEKAYAIFIDTFCDGSVPTLTNGEGVSILFSTEEKAQAEIDDCSATRISEGLEDDLDECVVPVVLNGDGTFSPEGVPEDRFGPYIVE
jgi:hypothetical protein